MSSSSPFLQVIFQRINNLENEDLAARTIRVLMKRSTNTVLLPQASDAIDMHHEMIAIAFCAMDAKVGRCMYRSGSLVKREATQIGDKAVL